MIQIVCHSDDEITTVLTWLNCLNNSSGKYDSNGQHVSLDNATGPWYYFQWRRPSCEKPKNGLVDLAPKFRDGDMAWLICIEPSPRWSHDGKLIPHDFSEPNGYFTIGTDFVRK